MLRRASVVCYLLFASYTAFSQSIRLTGKVEDAQHQPVPYASVALPDGAAGTATNEVGEFSLTVPVLPQRLVVLSIGYARTEVVAASAAPLTITLPPSTVQLPEVVVRNPQRVAEDLVQRAYAKLARHENDTYYGKAFYRQKTRTNGTYDELSDAFYDVELTPQKIVGWELGESRYAAVAGPFHMKNFSTLMRLPTFTRHPKRGSMYLPLAADAAKRFTFALREIQTENGRETAVIDFQPRPGLDKPAPAGTLYLDQQTAALRRQELRLRLGSMLTFSKGFQPLSDSLRLVSDFAPVADSLTRLTSTRGELAVTMQAGNKPPVQSALSAYLLLYQYTGRLPGQSYGRVKHSTDDLQTLQNRPYNARFWQENEIIRASPVEESVIRSFEGRRVFGRL
ncbi:carboxypeptidase-like regulatory domain-containing protein [Hymenobacter aerilatus]|uniref:Carboxypeptidase-like regulatory domain-containing protein n=1 Tax=Hymenobacter aerilatus TaxID=2932251 RepID=A0A8T9SNW5_9BACT|nr:carboxypeptidase-like regulatory domain-containing protein [Hymenobacter aerilatus]UOR03818.1 carboxypeptidase-like regulatory domain-containing protein [Hymenobacter aerilatus]